MNIDLKGLKNALKNPELCDCTFPSGGCPFCGNLLQQDGSECFAWLGLAEATEDCCNIKKICRVMSGKSADVFQWLFVNTPEKSAVFDQCTEHSEDDMEFDGIANYSMLGGWAMGHGESCRGA